VGEGIKMFEPHIILIDCPYCDKQYYTIEENHTGKCPWCKKSVTIVVHSRIHIEVRADEVYKDEN